MKRYIRFKVKTLIKGMGLLLIFMFFTYIFLPSIIFSIGNRYSYKGKDLIAKSYYDRLDSYFPKDSTTAKALWAAAEISNRNTLFISASSIGSYTDMSYFSMEAKEYYLKLVERFPKTNEGRIALTALTNEKIKELIISGEIEIAYDTMVDYYKEINTGYSYTYYHPIVAQMAASTLRSQGLVEEAITWLEYYNTEVSGDNTAIYEMLADFNALLGNKTTAEYYYRLLLDRYEEDYKRQMQFSQQETEGFSSYYLEQLQVLQSKVSSLKDAPTTLGTVSGRVTLIDQPLGSVNLFLQPQDDNGRYVIGGTRENALWTISNSRGEYVFNNVPPGRYSLGLLTNPKDIGDVVLKNGFFPDSMLYVLEGESYNWDFEFVDTLKVTANTENSRITGDTLHLKWEKYVGASFYSLELGTYSMNNPGAVYTSTLNDRYFYTNEAILTADELSYTQGGIGYDENGPMPESLLGYGHPQGKYYWVVRAHDEKGNILTSSKGYIVNNNNDFQFSNRSLSKGDSLLIQGKYAESIEAYEEALARNPEDIYSKAMLAKIHNVPTTYTSNLEKSAKYYEELYEATKAPTFLSYLINAKYNSMDYSTVLELVDDYTEVNRPLQHHYMLAKIHAHNGNYKKAIKEINKAQVDQNLSIKASLMLVTDDYDSIVPKSQKEEMWMKALRQYQSKYAHLDKDLKKSISSLTPTEALMLLDKKHPSPNEGLLKLALENLDMTISPNGSRSIREWQSSNGLIDSELNRLIKVMFMTFY